MDPALNGRKRAVAPCTLATRCYMQLLGVLEITRERSGRGMPLSRMHFQRAQNELVQPGRPIRAQSARGYRLAIKTTAPFAHAARIAERPFAGDEEIEDDAEGKYVAARVGPIAEQLLRRDIGPGPDRARELFRQDVGQAQVSGKAEVDQCDFACRAQDDIARLQVKMNYLLAMNIVQCGGYLGTEACNGLGRQRQFGKLRAQGLGDN